MRPLGTQRPERPKSELWHNKYEKCGLSKACHGEWVRAAAVDIPRRVEKASRHLDLRRFAISRQFARHDSKMPGRYLVQALLVQEEVPRVAWCYDRLQTSMPIRGKP
jgi:hypothetical protein